MIDVPFKISDKNFVKLPNASKFSLAAFCIFLPIFFEANAATGIMVIATIDNCQS